MMVQGLQAKNAVNNTVPVVSPPTEWGFIQR